MKTTETFQTPRERRELFETLEKMPYTGYLPSNHVVINKERVIHKLPELERCHALDAKARYHAILMLEKKKTLSELDNTCLKQMMSDCESNEGLIIGLNVAYGKTIKELQKSFMTKKKQKQNILNGTFKRMGVATAADQNGYIYMCQIFTI